MYKEYLHTLMSKYCSNVVLLLYCIFNSSFIFKTLHGAVFTSRRNTTFSSKVGETGVGEQGISPKTILFTQDGVVANLQQLFVFKQTVCSYLQYEIKLQNIPESYSEQKCCVILRKLRVV